MILDTSLALALSPRWIKGTGVAMADKEEPVSKGDQHNEELAQSTTHATYFDKNDVASLSEEHRQYLLNRHGTLELDPLPTMGDADPYNWPQWKVGIPVSPNSQNIR